MYTKYLLLHMRALFSFYYFSLRESSREIVPLQLWPRPKFVRPWPRLPLSEFLAIGNEVQPGTILYRQQQRPWPEICVSVPGGVSMQPGRHFFQFETLVGGSSSASASSCLLYESPRSTESSSSPYKEFILSVEVRLHTRERPSNSHAPREAAHAPPPPPPTSWGAPQTSSTASRPSCGWLPPGPWRGSERSASSAVTSPKVCPTVTPPTSLPVSCKCEWGSARHYSLPSTAIGVTLLP